MFDEFGECYPLHLGVTEAGDGEDGRIKSAIGIGTLMEDGLGDTIRVSLTEDPEFEIPVCKDICEEIRRKSESQGVRKPGSRESGIKRRFFQGLSDLSSFRLPYNPFEYKRRETFEVG